MTILCRSFGYSKQAYYRSQHLGSRLERECYLVSLVEEIRDDMPRLGGLKLWKLLNDNGVRIGRDELYDILRRRGLLVKRVYIVRLNELYCRVESDKQQSDYSCIYRGTCMPDILRMVEEMPV